jgi:hypothetical protein
MGHAQAMHTVFPPSPSGQHRKTRRPCSVRVQESGAGIVPNRQLRWMQLIFLFRKPHGQILMEWHR